ncbi:efflux RND transporter periplasmic adaptor subunit [Vibrio caribbeanicus]|uniref:efflux RND transporter periplasmic adaptor subunit n=1 Tax=Vibrio caribbeanicus TaxID=701175 RepID=UPI0022850157|nr:efflux RND transporter periplasmic adaptor subunit [Vibrio caribbeanicus]MCY9844294.1 efflux RND transporter periplasmic adaptor subunit [Vibrio caribbeanicus]
MSRSWVMLIMACLLIASAGVYYLSQSDQTISQPTLTIETGTIEKKAVAVGSIVPAHSVSIKSQNNGIVGEIYVKVGEKVKQGQALIKVSPNPTPKALTDASTDLMRSQAALESAKQKLNNLQRLLDEKIIPANFDEYVSARSEVKSAQADMMQKRQNLELIRSGEATVGDAKLSSTIYAPIDGTVLNLKVEVGEPIISTESSQAATEMMSLADMKAMIFKGSVSEHDAAMLAPDMKAMITVAPFPDKPIQGLLNTVAIQSQKRNNPTDTEAKSFDNGFEVEVDNLDIPSDIHLRSGFSANADITLKKVENVLVVPERALKFEGEVPMVLIPDSSKQGFHTQPVTLGLSDGIHVEVLKGVNQGQAVVDNSMVSIDVE